MTEANDVNPANGPTAKRRRIALACNSCRTRKTRCNGAQPKCSLCENFNFECRYEPTDSTTNIVVRKDYLTALEQRLETLERTVHEHSRRLSFNQSQHQRSNQSLGQHLLEPNSIHLDASGFEELPLEGVTDGMAMSFVDEQDSCFFGPSSIIALLRHIIQAMSSLWGISQPHTPRVNEDTLDAESGFVNTSRAPSPSNPMVSGHECLKSALILPSHDEMERLLRTYFANTGLLFPFIHEDSFMHTYRVCRESSFRNVRRTWLGLLNIIFAMATSTDNVGTTAASKRIADSEVFYERATALCGRQMLRGTNLETVQYLLLMSQYLQGTQNSVQTWMIHGLAVKAGLSIGLQSNNAGSRFSELEQEIRKRTWYGCVLLDRSLSIAFGRPFTISNEHIKIPLPQHWPLDSEPTSYQGELKAPSTAFFTATINLYDISDRVIKRLYDGNLGCRTPVSADMVPDLFAIEQDLSHWSMQLPEELTLIQSNDTAMLSESSDPSRLRFRVVLTLRYLNVELLLQRPFLVRSLGMQSPDTQSRQMSRSLENLGAGAIQASVKAAQESISIVHKILAHGPVGRQMLGAWWFTLFYIFNAALTVFSIVLIDPSRGNITPSLAEQPQTTALQHLATAIHALEQLDPDNAMVTRCRNYLQYLSKLLELRSQTGPEGLHSSNGMTLLRDGTQDGNDTSGTLELFADALPSGFPGLELADILNGDVELGRYFFSG